jgi:hypothetical protein
MNADGKIDFVFTATNFQTGINYVCRLYPNRSASAA